MSVRIGNDGAASPPGLFGWCNDCRRIIIQGCKDSIDARNSEANPGASAGKPVWSEGIKFKHTAGKFGRKMFRSRAMPVLGELQPELGVEGGSPGDVRGP